jgi:hypothetical protein
MHAELIRDKGSAQHWVSNIGISPEPPHRPGVERGTERRERVDFGVSLWCRELPESAQLARCGASRRSSPL